MFPAMKAGKPLAMQVINTTPLPVHVSTPPASSDPCTRRLLMAAKATFDIDPDGTPRLDTQNPEPIFTRETKDARFPGFVLPPDPAVQVLDGFEVMLVHRVELDTPAKEVELTLTIGAEERRMRVVGDRQLVRGVASEPLPFSEMPLTWERAYGGMPVFEVAPDARLPMAHPANPLGRGYFPTEAAEALTEMLGYADEGFPRAMDPAPLLPNLLPIDQGDAEDPAVVCWAPMPGAVSLRLDLSAAAVAAERDATAPRDIADLMRSASRDLCLASPPEPGALLRIRTSPPSPARVLRFPKLEVGVHVAYGQTTSFAALEPQHLVWFTNTSRCAVTYRLAGRFTDHPDEPTAVRLELGGMP